MVGCKGKQIKDMIMFTINLGDPDVLLGRGRQLGELSMFIASLGDHDVPCCGVEGGS